MGSPSIFLGGRIRPQAKGGAETVFPGLQFRCVGDVAGFLFSRETYALFQWELVGNSGVPWGLCDLVDLNSLHMGKRERHPMNGGVGKMYWYPTDSDWFDFLSHHHELEEVNFWQPNGKSSIGCLPAGSPFLFRMKAPANAVGGFGVLVRHIAAPAALAWESFGIANGAPDYETMLRRIEDYRGVSRQDRDPHYEIGCIMLQRPVFFPREAWIPHPKSWPVHSPKGATYPATREQEAEARDLWSECELRAKAIDSRVPQPRPPLAADAPRFGREQGIRPRLGQATFRLSVIDAYGRACAVTGEHALPVLEAAHIKPFTMDGPHEVSNGLLLRADLHKLFDRGLVSITPERQLVVSRRLRRDFQNGRVYYELEDRIRNAGGVTLPARVEDRPDPALLDRHFRERFVDRAG